LSLVIAVAAAIAAAVVFGIASVADQRSTKRVKRRRALSPRIFVDLARQPLWIASLGGTVLGFVLQVLALRFGPLALVEPLLVLDLIFAVLINSFLRKNFDPVLLGGVVATTAGIAWFLVVAQPSSGTSSVSFAVVLPLGAGLAAAVLGCLAVAARSQQLRPLALALACGINYGVAAFLVKLVVSDVSGGLPGLLTNWPIYALAIVGPMGFLLNENAFQQGTLIAPVLAIITACDPIISIALAAIWLNETLNDTPAGIAGEVSALILMVSGIVVVAHRAPHLAPQPSSAVQNPLAASAPCGPATALTQPAHVVFGRRRLAIASAIAPTAAMAKAIPTPSASGQLRAVAADTAAPPAPMPRAVPRTSARLSEADAQPSRPAGASRSMSSEIGA
jgi:drug/metabolite transporter (DMT)-like permease